MCVSRSSSNGYQIILWHLTTLNNIDDKKHLFIFVFYHNANLALFHLTTIFRFSNKKFTQYSYYYQYIVFIRNLLQYNFYFNEFYNYVALTNYQYYYHHFFLNFDKGLIELLGPYGFNRLYQDLTNKILFKFYQQGLSRHLIMISFCWLLIIIFIILFI